jgi:hypothetical protein
MMDWEGLNDYSNLIEQPPSNLQLSGKKVKASPEIDSVEIGELLVGI